jgi:type II secretory pathway pseudopilin PulG
MSQGIRSFSLIEVLVVVAILALLFAVLLPSLALARRQVQIVNVHSDLRQISIAIDAYAMNNEDKLPPTRSGCGTDVNYQLPIELANEKYLPASQSKIPQAHWPDYFQPEQTYRYRAPGPIWFNGSFFDFPNSTWRMRAKIWVPEDFPRSLSDEGRYYHNRAQEPKCPVRYAVWSIGPDVTTARFPRKPDDTDAIDESKFPIPRRYWLTQPNGAGLITHIEQSNGSIIMSP